MKVLFVGFKYDYGRQERGESLEFRAFYPAIRQLAHECHGFWLEDHGFPTDLRILENNLKQCAININPDLIFFILMNDELSFDILAYLKENFITVNWFADDQWRFESFTKNIAICFTYSISVDKFSFRKYKELGISPILSQWASSEYSKNLSLDDVKYRYEVSFVGAKNLVREWVICELRQAGIAVECFGSGWSNGKISYEELSAVFLNSKINLNLSNSIPRDRRFVLFVIKKLFLIVLNPLKGFIEKKDFFKNFLYLFLSKKRTEQIKARNFEIPSCGGFQISKFALQIDDYYTPGKEIIVFSELDELERLIFYYLENEEERKQICYNGYIKSENHTYFKRFEVIFPKLKTNTSR